jgi:hypothetical protein
MDEILTALDKRRAALAERVKQLDRKLDDFSRRGKALTDRVAKAAPAELEGAFRTSNPKEIIERVRRGQKGAATLGGMVGIVVTVVTAYLLVESIKYVLDADSVMDGVGRALEVGGTLAAGAAEQALLTYLAGSAAGGVGLGIILTMPSDQGGAAEAEAEKARRKAEKERTRQLQRQEYLAVGRFLEKNVPGSVEWVEDTFIIHDQKLWDRTVKQVRQLRTIETTRQRAQMSKRAYELGMSDGRFSDQFLRQDEIKDWPEVKNWFMVHPDVLFLELFGDYKAGFKQGNAKRAALLERARKLGYGDGKKGQKIHYEEWNHWPEVNDAVKAGAYAPSLFKSLYESYDEAFAAVSS